MKSASKIFILDSSFCTDLPLDLIISQLIFAFAKRCLNAVPTASLDCLNQNKTKSCFTKIKFRYAAKLKTSQVSFAHLLIV